MSFVLAGFGRGGQGRENLSKKKEILKFLSLSLMILEVNWQPPFGKANHGPLHPSLERPTGEAELPCFTHASCRWPGRKVGWAELYELDIDLNLVFCSDIEGLEAEKGRLSAC